MPTSQHETRKNLLSLAAAPSAGEMSLAPADSPHVESRIGGGVCNELGRHLNELGQAEQQRRDRQREEELARLRQIQQFD